MILAISSSTEMLSVAVVDWDGRCLSEAATSTNRYSEALTSLMTEALAAVGMRPADLRDKAASIAVDIGPGSFTGTRASLATAKTIAQVLSLPLIGVPATDALALGASAGMPKGSILRAALDARRGHVYYVDYSLDSDGTLRRATHPRLEPVELFGKMSEATVVGTAGPGGEVPQAVWVGRAALHMLDAPDDPLTLQPIYWRHADARTLKERGLDGPGVRA